MRNKGDIDVYLLVVPQSDPCLVTALNSLREKIIFFGIKNRFGIHGKFLKIILLLVTIVLIVELLCMIFPINY